MICYHCKKHVDKHIEANGLCVIHGSDFCWDCGNNVGCQVPNERCDMQLITNPQWKFKLREK